MSPTSFSSSSPRPSLWYEAVCVAHDDEQHALVVALETLLSTRSLAWRVARLVTLAHRLVIVTAADETGASPASVSQEDLDHLHHILAPYQPVQLPPTLLVQLHPHVSAQFLAPEQRAEEQSASSQEAPERGLLLWKTAPHLITFTGSIEPLPRSHGAETDESRDPSLFTSPSPVSPFALIDCLREQALASVLMRVVPSLQAEITWVFQRLVDEAAPYLFSVSADQMHAEIIAHEEALHGPVEEVALEDFLARVRDALRPLFRESRGLLFIFERPKRHRSGVVKGLFFHPCAPHHLCEALAAQDPTLLPRRDDLLMLLDTSAGLWNLDLLSEDGSPLLRWGYESGRDSWVLSDHPSIRSQQCEWLHWLMTAYKMLRKHYARTPEPPHFPQQDYHSLRQALVPRRHGKGKPKSKWVEHTLRVTTITYEVSLHRERPYEEGVSDTDAHAHDGLPDAPKRLNWLSQTHPDDLLYEQREIEPHTRRYPQRKDGTRRAGHVDVVYQEPKWVPLLKPEKRKTRIRRKVVSQQHQSSLVQPYPTVPRDHSQARDDEHEERT